MTLSLISYSLLIIFFVIIIVILFLLVTCRNIRGCTEYKARTDPDIIKRGVAQLKKMATKEKEGKGEEELVLVVGKTQDLRSGRAVC